MDMPKISQQMGNISARTDFYPRILPIAGVFAVARDLTCRGSYMLLLDESIRRYQSWLSTDNNRKYHLYFGCAIAATLLSHPFDLVFTKIASQRSLRYKGILQTLRLIVNEQGYGKFYSRISYRFFYSLLSVILMGNCYEPLMMMSLEAF